MKTSIKKNMKKNMKKGFTLIELIVVIIIIGALAGIAVAKLGGSDDSAKKATAKSDVRQGVAVVNKAYANDQAIPADNATFLAAGMIKSAATDHVLYTAVNTIDYTVCADITLSTGTYSITYTSSTGALTEGAAVCS